MIIYINVDNGHDYVLVMIMMMFCWWCWWNIYENICCWWILACYWRRLNGVSMYWKTLMLYVMNACIELCCWILTCYWRWRILCIQSLVMIFVKICIVVESYVHAYMTDGDEDDDVISYIRCFCCIWVTTLLVMVPHAFRNHV